MSSITVSRRFAGPPGSANGGYLAGALAGYVDHGSPVTVTLRRPPPLETELRVESQGEGVALLQGDGVLAEATPGRFAHDTVAPLEPSEARVAESSYAGLSRHPFPGCFVCGTDRSPGDGLRLAPGLIGAGRTACTWVPDAGLANPDQPETTRPEFGWAALDCPGAWTSDLELRPLVLGRMTALCDEPPVIGQAHVVVGRLIEEAGRKTVTATTLYDPDGRILGRAEHIWIAIDPAEFGA